MGLGEAPEPRAGVKGAGEAGVMLLSRAHVLLSSIHGRSVSPEVQARLFWGRREQMPERLCVCVCVCFHSAEVLFHEQILLKLLLAFGCFPVL